LTVVAPGTQKRAFTYVKDLACGIILAGQSGVGDGYALGAPTSYSILQIAEAFGGPIRIVEGYAGREESGNDPTKAREDLGWESTLGVMDYIRDFTRKHPRNHTRPTL
jgi:UDP-glucose 4-epimerase